MEQAAMITVKKNAIIMSRETSAHSKFGLA